jgi:hypothetical protein
LNIEPDPEAAMTRRLSLQSLEERTNPSLSYVSYFGGDTSDEITSVGFDAAGDLYLAGRTDSTAIPLGSTPNGTLGRAFVAKMDPTATTLIWRTYIASDPISGMAVDAAGDAYITGDVAHTGFATVGAAQSTYGGNGDAFAAKLNPSGSIVYATYIGGNQLDSAHGIAIDSAGDAFVTGYTTSPNFPNQNALQGSLHANSGEDAFVTKINPTGTQFLFSTYLGGNANGPGEGGATFSIGNAIAVDKAGNPYVTGITEAADFVSANPFQAQKGYAQDVFVTELKTDGSQGLYSTFLSGAGQTVDSGNGDDEGNAIAVDANGNILVAGYTTSLHFPTKNAFVKTEGDGDPGPADGFVTKLDPTKTGIDQLVYSTYIGGNAIDTAYSIGLDPAGDAYVGGSTGSQIKFPLVHPFQKSAAGGGFLAKFSPTGHAQLCSYFGAGGEKVERIAVSPFGPPVFVGNTQSNRLQTTSNAFQSTFPGATDSGFIAMLAGANRKATGTDSDGDKWTVSLHGPGAMAVTADPNTGAIASIVLEGTTSRSSLSIHVRKAKTGDGFVDVGSITGPGIGSISAAKANLTGTGINLTGSLGRLTVHDILNGAGVVAAGTSTDSTQLIAHVLGAGTTVETGGSLGLLRAAQVRAATIQAVDVKRLEVVGDAKAGLAGFAAVVTLTGTDTVIESARIVGAYAGTITANAGGIASFIAETFQAGSNVTASVIGKVKLGTVATGNGGIKFGFHAHVSIKSVVVGKPQFVYDPMQPTPQGVGDFEVVIS